MFLCSWTDCRQVYYLTKQWIWSAMYVPPYWSVFSDVFRCQNSWKGLELHGKYKEMIRYVPFKRTYTPETKQHTSNGLKQNLEVTACHTHNTIVEYWSVLALCATSLLTRFTEWPVTSYTELFVGHLFKSALNQRE